MAFAGMVLPVAEAVDTPERIVAGSGNAVQHLFISRLRPSENLGAA